ncbi:MAG: hypothetical protein HC899_14335 [Leptolyngbyaceae cyanobacterium SM1_4_3]|nr:hypothetical protein [Leptolyngbyaceae cyanobacterium SM1_4_3]
MSALSQHPQITVYGNALTQNRSQLTPQISGGREPRTQHQRLSTVRCI